MHLHYDDNRTRRGAYTDHGLEYFLKSWGYQGDDGRWRITGRHFVDYQHERTNLSLRLRGYDVATNKLTDVDGGLELVDESGTVTFVGAREKLLSKWKDKHQNTAIVPAKKQVIDGVAYFKFDKKVLLCEGGDIYRMLRCIADGRVYFDPVLLEPGQMEEASDVEESQALIHTIGV